MMILGQDVAVPPGIEEVAEWGEDDTEMTDIEMTVCDMDEKKERGLGLELSLAVETMMVQITSLFVDKNMLLHPCIPINICKCPPSTQVEFINGLQCRYVCNIHVS